MTQEPLFFDDPVFPTTPAGLRASGMILESAVRNDAPDAPDAMTLQALQQQRSQAMSAVLAWIEDGEFTFTTLDEYVLGIVDLDGDFEITAEEEDIYNGVLAQVPDALMTLGVSAEDANALINDEDDGAAARIGKQLAAMMDEYEADDEEIIAGFALGEDALFENADEGRHMILEASYKRRKVVRDGKVEVINKRVSGTVRLSAARKAGLKKARLKSHSGSAKLARRKSMRLRERSGL